MSSPVAQRHADRAILAPASSRIFKARTHARFFLTSPTRNENRTLLEYRTGAAANQHPPWLCIDSTNRLTPTIIFPGVFFARLLHTPQVSRQTRLLAWLPRRSTVRGTSHAEPILAACRSHMCICLRERYSWGRSPDFKRPWCALHAAFARFSRGLHPDWPRVHAR
jgi:hypothetical protein